MKLPAMLIAAVLLLLAPCAHAQFGWDEEPEQTAAADSFDAFDAARRTTVIEPIEPVEDPVTAIFQPFVSPVLDADPLVEDCDLEPQVAQVYRAAVIAEADCPTYLGRLSANPYASDSTANPYSPAGSPYSSRSVNNPYGPYGSPNTGVRSARDRSRMRDPQGDMSVSEGVNSSTSINNPYSTYGSPFSPTSARNPYATDAPKIVAQDGTYLGELSDNPYDPDSVANPYGRYGSPYSSTSINNPYSTYGSRFSPQSPNNPYATQAPLLFGD